MFETVLAVGGRCVLASAHMERLARSARELYGMELPAGLDLTPPDASGCWRVRVVVRPGATAVVSFEAVDPGAVFPVEPVSLLRRLVVPGGLGAHKWVDRAAIGGPPEPLVIDSTGELLETGWGNLWIVEGGKIVTPPADGRILPGVTRAEVLRLADSWAEERIDAARFEAADEAFVTSAIRGIQPVGKAAEPVVLGLMDRLRLTFGT